MTNYGDYGARKDVERQEILLPDTNSNKSTKPSAGNEKNVNEKAREVVQPLISKEAATFKEAEGNGLKPISFDAKPKAEMQVKGKLSVEEIERMLAEKTELKAKIKEQKESKLEVAETKTHLGKTEAAYSIDKAKSAQKYHKENFYMFSDKGIEQLKIPTNKYQKEEMEALFDSHKFFYYDSPSKTIHIHENCPEELKQKFTVGQTLNINGKNIHIGNVKTLNSQEYAQMKAAFLVHLRSGLRDPQIIDKNIKPEKTKKREEIVETKGPPIEKAPPKPEAKKPPKQSSDSTRILQKQLHENAVKEDWLRQIHREEKDHQVLEKLLVVHEKYVSTDNLVSSLKQDLKNKDSQTEQKIAESRQAIDEMKEAMKNDHMLESDASKTLMKNIIKLEKKLDNLKARRH